MTEKNKKVPKRKKPKTSVEGIVEKITSDAQELGQNAMQVIESELPHHLALSNALVKMIESEMEHLNSLSDHEFMLYLIVTAWNHSVASKYLGEPPPLELTCQMLGFNKKATKLFEHFIKKKETLFPNDMSLVNSWDCRFEGENFLIIAECSPMKSPPTE
jgi:hypothetical protein